MAESRDTLFLKIAIQNQLIRPEDGERVLSTLAERREIGVERTAWEIARELDLIGEAEAAKISEAVILKVPPSRIAGFQLEEPIGKGAVGTVYRARQVSLDKPVAVKLLHPKHTAEERFVTDFLREAKSLAKLNHPNIVHAIDAGETEGRYYFAMELVEGESLREKLGRREKLSPTEALEFAQQIADGLAHAHRHGLLHRDLKPDNILIGEDGRVRIADLGLAIPLDDGELLAAEHRKQGTPFYLSPEQAQGQEIDARSDLYSLGATLYHCVAGKPVFTGGTVKEILKKQVHQDPVPVAEAAGASGPLDDIIMKLLSKQPGDRYQTAEEVVAAIGRASSGTGGGRRAPGSAPRSRKRPPGAGRPDAKGRTGPGGSKVGEPSSRGPSKPVIATASSSSANKYRSRNRVASMVGAGVGILIAVFFLFSGLSKAGAGNEAPTTDAKHDAALERRAQRIIEQRIADWHGGIAEEDSKALERAEAIIRNADDDNLRRRGLKNLLEKFPASATAPRIIQELEKVSEEMRSDVIAGAAELLEEARGLRADGKLWTAYLLLDDRPREAKKDLDMNRTIDEFLSDLEEEIDAAVLRDLASAREKRDARDYDGAIAVLEGVRSYADPKSIGKADELATEIAGSKAEYAKAEQERLVQKERDRYRSVFPRYRDAAMGRNFKDGISAAIELQAEMGSDEVRNYLEVDLNGFAALDQFQKDALAQLAELAGSDTEVSIEMKPIGESPRGRRWQGTVDKVEDDRVFIEVNRAIFPLDVEKITDQTIFDLVLERHGEGSPSYLIPLGILFLYRGNYDIAESHFDLARDAGTSPDTWYGHLEVAKKYAAH